MKGDRKQSRRYTTFLFLLSALSLSQVFLGCSSLFSGYGVKPIIKDAVLPSDLIPEIGPDGKPKKDAQGNVILVEKSMYVKIKKLMQIDPDSESFKYFYRIAKDTSNVPDATKARDHLISRMMLLSDRIYEAHKADILGRQASFNIATGSVTSIFSGAATVIGGETVKSGLAAGAALSNSTNSLVNKEIYYKTLAITIVKATGTDRKAKRDAIETKRQGDITIYSVDQAIWDAQQYHFAGSFLNGLRIISEALDKRKPSTEELQTKIAILEAQIEKGNTMINKLTKERPDEVDRIKNLSAGNLELETKLNELKMQLADAW